LLESYSQITHPTGITAQTTGSNGYFTKARQTATKDGRSKITTLFSALISFAVFERISPDKNTTVIQLIIAFGHQQIIVSSRPKISCKRPQKQFPVVAAVPHY
jgi:hypothetical protein